MELQLSPIELNLDYTLGCGQAFRWRKQEGGSWIGVVQQRYVKLRQHPDRIECLVIPEKDQRELLESYFRLDIDLSAIGQELAERDEHIGELFKRYAGLRLLKQDPLETLMSFICSAVNSIPMIESAIERLSLAYGRRICVLDDVCYHEFPDSTVFAEEDSETLAKVGGLGFRGASLKKAALQILEHREYGWLESLSDLPYEAAKRELVSLNGVGNKIADCVCLFALCKDEAVPVDTHIRQSAQRLYLPDVAGKNVTAAVYRRISTFFREHFGQYAGWAQQYLYYEELLRARDYQH